MTLFTEIDLIYSPDKPLDGYMQMSIDEYLMNTVSKPTLRIYSWKSPCVTFGYFQKIDDVSMMNDGNLYIRRLTGGGIVQHGHDFTFSLMIPRAEQFLSPRDFYHQLHSKLIPYLETVFDHTIAIVQNHQIFSKIVNCFEHPSVEDLLVNNKKILGGAQRKCYGNLLHQGSLQFYQKNINPYLFAQVVGKNIRDLKLTKDDIAKAKDISTKRYASSGWLNLR